MLLRATIEGTKTEDVCDNRCRSIFVVLPSFGVQHLRMLLRYLVEKRISTDGRQDVNNTQGTESVTKNLLFSFFAWTRMRFSVVHTRAKFKGIY